VKVFKPQKLSVLTRSFVQERHPFFSVAVLSLHRFDGAMLSEAEMWKFLPAQLGPDGVPDAGMVKSKAEFLVTGSAFQANGQAGTTCAISARVGDLEKRIQVTGDRHWDGSEPTDPLPFVELPLSWAYAFGGEGYDRNPLGKGAAEVETERGPVVPLPNLENPEALLRSPADRPAPSSFGAVDFLWPQRQAKAGTYDQQWLDTQFPGHALDMDWTIFNAASEDQQLPSVSFVGDEEFELRGLHPTKPVLTGRLPRLAARCLVDCESEGDASFQEVPLGLTTVWFFPSSERYLLVFHGAIAVQEDDGADVRYLMIGGEDQGTPKSLDHYQGVFEQRTHPEEAAIHGLNDVPLMPEREALLVVPDGVGDELKDLLKKDYVAQTYMKERGDREREEARARVEAEGLDPDVYCPLPEPVPDPPEDLLEALHMLNEEQAKAEAQLAKSKADSAEKHAAARVELEERGLDPDDYLADPAALPVGPPTFQAETKIAEIVETLNEARERGIDIPELTAMVEEPGHLKRFFDAEEAQREAYRQFAHEQGEAPRLVGTEAASARARVEQMLTANESLVRQDFTGFDLSGLDLSGRDLSGCWMENADLSGANLSGSNLKSAVLARADLTGANLQGAKLQRANIGETLFKDTVADDADLEEAVIARTRFEGASLKGANLQRAWLYELDAPVVDLSGAQLEKQTFIKFDLRGLSLRAAQLDGAQFLESDLSGVDFAGAALSSVAFVETKADGACFDKATLTGSCFVLKTSLVGASFCAAMLDSTNLRGAPLRGSNFQAAGLKGCDLSECDLSEANLSRVSAVGALLIRTNLQGSTLEGADFAEAILQKSDLRGANLNGVNFYGADLSLVHRDGLTSTEESNQDRTRLVPERYVLPPVPEHLPWMHS